MTDYYRDEMGQLITPAFGDASPDEIRRRSLQHFQKLKHKAFSNPPDYVDVIFAAAPAVQAMERRFVERGHGLRFAGILHRQVTVCLSIMAALFAGFAAAGVLGNQELLAVCSAGILLVIAGVAAARAYGSATYLRALYLGAYDGLSEVEYALERERGLHAEAELRRREMEAECDLALDLQQAPLGERYIYVLGFSTGGVKVGQTFDPARRIREHRRDAAAFGVNLVSFWVSPPHLNYLATEASLIACCLDVSTPVRKEYFPEVSFSYAVHIANQLPLQSRDSSRQPTQGGRR